MPGMCFTLMILMIVVAFQWMPRQNDASYRGKRRSSACASMPADSWRWRVDDEWGTTVGSSYRQPHTPAELERELRRLYAERTADRVLHLKADTTVPFGVIEQAMVIAGRAGVRVVAACDGAEDR